MEITELPAVLIRWFAPPASVAGLSCAVLSLSLFSLRLYSGPALVRVRLRVRVRLADEVNVGRVQLRTVASGNVSQLPNACMFHSGS
jgi:hypothetical protein